VYEWDEAKRLGNLRKHGVDFAEVEGFLWEYSISSEDRVAGYGEQRVISIGPIGLRLFVLVWAPRGDVVRVISLRPANGPERTRYEKEF
jgi:uncharacterized DUF497 family protein